MKIKLDKAMFDLLDNIKEITQRFKYATSENKRELVKVFCENLRWENEKLRWDWKKIYETLAKKHKGLTLLPLVDLFRNKFETEFNLDSVQSLLSETQVDTSFAYAV